MTLSPGRRRNVGSDPHVCIAEDDDAVREPRSLVMQARDTRS
jgi:hypothetical protein